MLQEQISTKKIPDLEPRFVLFNNEAINWRPIAKDAYRCRFLNIHSPIQVFAKGERSKVKGQRPKAKGNHQKMYFDYNRNRSRSVPYPAKCRCGEWFLHPAEEDYDDD
jgi:hypothetical protein